MSDDATATTEEEDKVYKVLCGNLLHHIEGLGDPKLEKLTDDYVNPNRRAVKSEQTKRVTIARENVIQDEKDGKVQKKVVSDYANTELKGKRELQDKEQELEKVGNEHHTKWNHLSKRHRQMDDMVKERIRRMYEAHDAQKEGERKQLEITQENNPSLRRLADEIESARGDLTIIVNKRK